MTRRTWPLLVACLVAAPVRAADPAPLLARIKAVKSEGGGNAEAAKAWRELVAAGPDALLPTLAAFDGADATAANWLRNAVDAVAERELAAGRKLPADRLEAFVKDARQSPVGRRLAYEWLGRVDATAPARLVPGFLDDRSVDLRRDAVAVALKDAETLLDKGDKDGARAAYLKAFAAARDRDQVDLAAKQLKKLGEDVDLAAHFGYVRRWNVVGPFDNAGGKGYAIPSEPEKAVDLRAAYRGKGAKDVRWLPVASDAPDGLVDLNKALGEAKGIAAYAYAEVESPKERPAEIRAATKNAVKVFFNGQLVYSKEEYHHGKYPDQHAARVTLKPGRNALLVKVCQNEQTESWTKEWDFHLRVCDEVGGAVPLTVVTPAPAKEK